jgi:hypothetical protein
MSKDGLWLAVTSAEYSGTVGALHVYNIFNADLPIYFDSATGSDTVFGDAFGFSVAINQDGSYIVVGAVGDDNSGGTDAGSVYVFTREYPGGIYTLTEQTRLDAGEGFGIGYSVSLNDDASKLATGTIDGTASGSNIGSVYTFTRSATTWTASQDLYKTGSESFGAVVSLDSTGVTMAVTDPSTTEQELHIFDNIVTTSTASWDATNKVYTITDNKWVTNAILNALNITPTVGYDLTMNLITTTTTPTPATATRSQRVTRS